MSFECQKYQQLKQGQPRSYIYICTHWQRSIIHKVPKVKKPKAGWCPAHEGRLLPANRPDRRSLTLVNWAIFLLIFRCRSWVYSIAMPGWKVTLLDAEDELNFP